MKRLFENEFVSFSEKVEEIDCDYSWLAFYCSEAGKYILTHSWLISSFYNLLRILENLKREQWPETGYSYKHKVYSSEVESK